MIRRRTWNVNLLASWANYGIGLLIGLFLTPFVLRALGDETYGLWIFINSVAGYSGLFYLGFGQTISRYVAEYEAREEWGLLNRVVSLILAVYLCMGGFALVLAGVLIPFAANLHDWGSIPIVEIQLVILILGINIAVGLAGSVFGGVLIGVQRFDLVRGISVVSGLLRLALTVGALSAEWSLLTLAIIMLTVTIVENLANAVFAFRTVPTLSVRFADCNRESLRTYSSFSIFAFIDAVAARLIDATDTIVIGLFLGAQAIVPYYIAQRLCQFICLPIHHIGGISMPRAGELEAGGQRELLRDLFQRSVGLAFLLAAAAFVGAGFFGNTVIVTWVGPSYAESHNLLLVLLGAQIVATPIRVVRSVLFGIGQARVPALIYLGEAVANLALTLILIKPYGLLGVALGTAIPVVLVELFILLPYALRTLGIAHSRLIRVVLGRQIAPLASLWVYALIIDLSCPPAATWPQMFAVATGGVGVVACVWLVVERFHRSRRTSALQPN